MKKTLLVVGLLLLAGCTVPMSEKSPTEVVDADRSAGMVDVGFFHYNALPLSGNPSEADWSKAPSIAEDFCKKWGYSSAEPLNSQIMLKGPRNGFGDLREGVVYKRYQCTTDKDKITK